MKHSNAIQKKDINEIRERLRGIKAVNDLEMNFSK